MAKISGVTMCEAYNRQYGTAFLPVMPTNLYGPGDNFDLESSHVLPAMLRKFHLGKLAQDNDWAAIQQDENRFGKIPADIMEGLKDQAGPRVTLWGTGQARREFMHVDDMAAACVYLGMETDCTELTNIGYGQDLMIRELAKRSAVVWLHGAARLGRGQTRRNSPETLDVSRLRSLGFSAGIELFEGLQKNLLLVSCPMTDKCPVIRGSGSR